MRHLIHKPSPGLHLPVINRAKMAEKLAPIPFTNAQFSLASAKEEDYLIQDFP